MIWVILFIPLCVWLCTAFVVHMSLLTLAAVALTVAIFFLIELRQIGKDTARSRTPLWVMCLMLLTLACGVFLR